MFCQVIIYYSDNLCLTSIFQGHVLLITEQFPDYYTRENTKSVKHNTCFVMNTRLTTAGDQWVLWFVCRRPRAPALWHVAGMGPGGWWASYPRRAPRSQASSLCPRPHSAWPSPRGTLLSERCRALSVSPSSLQDSPWLTPSCSVYHTCTNHYTLFLNLT